MLPFYESPLFLLPAGPKNLVGIFPLIDWNNVEEYFITLKDEDDLPIATSGLHAMGCYGEDTYRVHFLNKAAGCFDAINFNRVPITHESTSSTFQRPLPASFQKTDTGVERHNIKSNETLDALSQSYPEEAMDWLCELADSPVAFLEWAGTQGQADSFIPLVIKDTRIIKRKTENRFVYDFRLQFQMSNSNLTIRR